MAEQERRRQTDTKIRKFWHDWMPIITFCISALCAFGGFVWGVSYWKAQLENTLSELKAGQEGMKNDLANVQKEHHVLMVKVDQQDVKMDKVMFRLHIPLDDASSPDFYTWPKDQRIGPDANLDKELEQIYKNDKHSRVVPPDPVLGLMRVPPPPQDSTSNRNNW